MLSNVVDERFGPIISVGRELLPEAYPQDLLIYRSCIALSSEFGVPLGDRYAWGSSWGDAEEAWCAAIGEGVERYAGDLCFVSRMEDINYDSSDIVGANPLFNERQVKKSYINLINSDDKTYSGRVIAGVKISDNSSVLVPVARVFNNCLGELLDHERISPIPYGGIACGKTYLMALEHAFFELIERDAVITSWYLGYPWIKLVSKSDTLKVKSGKFSLSYMLLPSVTRSNVVVCIAHDLENNRVSLGSSAGRSAIQISNKAAAEAIMLHRIYDELANPNSFLSKLAKNDLTCPLLPWTNNFEEYRNFYVEDGYSKCVDLICHMQYFLSQTAVETFLNEVSCIETRLIEDIDVDRRSIIDIASIDPKIAAIDITPSDIRSLNLWVIRAVSDFFIPNTPAGLLPKAHPRLKGRLIRNSPIPYA